MNITVWLRAMRLQTLPVATSSLIVAVALMCNYAESQSLSINTSATVLCFIFAILAQITSNFANEYYDFVRGGDKAGREGFRRGVAEGDISPKAMKIATFVSIAIACAVGLCLVPVGGLMLIPLGLVIALAAFAYSAGPYPLSHHGLGESAVIVFFGIVPVCMTFYLSFFTVTLEVMLASVALGLISANVLIVNNYRDYAEDLASGKRTLAVVFGRKAYKYFYLANSIVAALLLLPAIPYWLSACYVAASATVFFAGLCRKEGKALNGILVATSLTMLLFAIAILVESL